VLFRSELAASSQRDVPNAGRGKVVLDIESGQRSILTERSAKRVLFTRLTNRKRARVGAGVRSVVDALGVGIVCRKGQSPAHAPAHIDVERMANAVAARIEIEIQGVETQVWSKHARARDGDYRSLQVRASQRVSEGAGRILRRTRGAQTRCFQRSNLINVAWIDIYERKE